MDPTELIEEAAESLGLDAPALSADNPLVLNIDDEVEVTLAPAGGAVCLLTRLAPLPGTSREDLEALLAASAAGTDPRQGVLAVDADQDFLVLVRQCEGLQSPQELFAALEEFLAGRLRWLERLGGGSNAAAQDGEAGALPGGPGTMLFA